MAKIKVNLDSLKPQRNWVRHKIKEGTQAFRILPPFGEESNGYPYKKWSLIWGLKDTETGVMRPVTSSLVNDKRCPVTEFVAALSELAETRSNNMKAKGVSKEEIKKNNEALNEVISRIRPKHGFFYNAIDQAGSVGILELKSTAHKQLKDLMHKYVQEYNQDPTSLNSNDDDAGVWFNVTREGMGFDTAYSVSKRQIQSRLNGKVVYEDDRSALPESVVNNYEDQAYNVHALYAAKTYDEIKVILQANMEDLSAKCPEVAEVAEQLGLLNPVTAFKATTPTKGAGKVTLNLGSQDEDDEEPMQEAPVSAKVATTPVTVTTTTSENRSILDMADELLGS